MASEKPSEKKNKTQTELSLSAASCFLSAPSQAESGCASRSGSTCQEACLFATSSILSIVDSTARLVDEPLPLVLPDMEPSSTGRGCVVVAVWWVVHRARKNSGRSLARSGRSDGRETHTIPIVHSASVQRREDTILTKVQNRMRNSHIPKGGRGSELTGEIDVRAIQQVEVGDSDHACYPGAAQVSLRKKKEILGISCNVLRTSLPRRTGRRRGSFVFGADEVSKRSELVLC